MLKLRVTEGEDCLLLEKHVLRYACIYINPEMNSSYMYENPNKVDDLHKDRLINSSVMRKISWFNSLSKKVSFVFKDLFALLFWLFFCSALYDEIPFMGNKKSSASSGTRCNHQKGLQEHEIQLGCLYYIL